jgi:hypothetical protein
MEKIISEQGEVQGAFIDSLIKTVNESSDALAFDIADSNKDQKVSHFYENDGNVFGLSQEVVDFGDQGLYIRIYEIEDKVFESLNESEIIPTTEIEIDDSTFQLGEEIFTTEDQKEFFVQLISENDDDESEDEEEEISDEDEFDTVEIDGEEYEVVKEEEESDGYVLVAYDDKDELQIVENEDEAEGVIYLKKKPKAE